MAQKQVEKNLNLIATSSIVVFIGIALSKVLGYLYRILIVRNFGVEVYGLFSIVFILTTLFATIAALGLSDGALRFVAFYRGKKADKKISYLVKTLSKILVITSILSALALFILSDFISIQIFNDPNLVFFLKLSSLAVPFLVLGTFYLIVLRAFEKISWYSFILNIFLNAIRVALLIGLIILGFKTNSVFFSYILSLVGMFIAAYLLSRFALSKVFVRYSLEKKDKKDILKQVLTYSFPLMFFSVISAIFYWIDSFSLGFFKGTLAVGVYNTAVPIALLIGIAPELFMQLFMPLITREYSRKNLTLIKELSKQVAKWILIINLPIAVLLILFPGAALNILFGVEALPAQQALRILAIGSLFSSIFIVSNQLVSMTGKSKLFLMNISIAAILNLILNTLLVPIPKIFSLENSNGLVGAALATTISLIVFNLLFLFQAYKLTRILPLRRKMFNVLLALAISSAILIILKGTMVMTTSKIILLSSSFILVYLALILIFRGFDLNDIAILKHIRSKLSRKSN